MQLSSILGRPDLAGPSTGDAPAGTLYGDRPTGELAGSGEVSALSSFRTEPDAGVLLVEPDRPSYTDAQDPRQLTPVDGVPRAVQAGAQHYYAVEYVDERELTGDHGVIVGRAALVSWTPATVLPFDGSPETVWREPPREDRPDLCGRGDTL